MGSPLHLLSLLKTTSVIASIPTRFDGVVFVFRALGSSVMDQMEAFDILASADRQLVLHELLERDGEARIEELSQRVAARRHRLSPEQIDETKVEHAHVRLVHTHFPKLRAKNVIDIDWAAGDVSLTDGADVKHLFDAAEEIDGWPPDDLLEYPARGK